MSDVRKLCKSCLRLTEITAALTGTDGDILAVQHRLVAVAVVIHGFNHSNAGLSVGRAVQKGTEATGTFEKVSTPRLFQIAWRYALLRQSIARPGFQVVG